MEHFCTCHVKQCPKHPLNHNNGCDPCMQDNIAKGKMPTCMFKAVSDDLGAVKDYTIKGFVDFYTNCHK